MIPMIRAFRRSRGGGEKSFERKKLEYGWVVCGACALVLFCTNGLASTGFAAYQPYFISIGGLSNTQASSLLTIRQLLGVIVIFGIPRLTQRFKLRALAITGMLICGLSFVSYGLVRSYPGYCLSAALAGISYGLCGTVLISAIISRWFNEHRGLAMGICMAATGLSATVATPFITSMVRSASLQKTFIIEAGFIFFLVALVCIFLRDGPDSVHTHPVGSEHMDVAKIFAHHSPRPGLYHRLMIGYFLFGFVGIILYPHLSVLFMTSGFADTEVSWIISTSGAAVLLGKCIYGELADKIGTYRATWVLYGLLTIGIIAGCAAAVIGNFPLAEASVILMGLGLPIGSLSIPLYSAGVSTESQYTKTVTQFQLMITLGGLVFGTVPGMIADHTGSYVPAFALMLATCVFCAVLMQSTYLAVRKADR